MYLHVPHSFSAALRAVLCCAAVCRETFALSRTKVCLRRLKLCLAGVRRMKRGFDNIKVRSRGWRGWLGWNVEM